MPNIIGTAPNQVPTNADLGTMAYQDSNAVKVKDITFNDGSSQQTAASGFGFKNRIINGAMMIDQRNAGASVNSTSLTFSVDRWKAYGSQISKYTAQQNGGSVTPPQGFTNYLAATSLSSYSVPSTDYFCLQQRIEGYNIADLSWGTANAKAVTLSFQVYSSLTGTFGGSLQNSAENYSYPFSYSITAANTWTSVSIVISGPTSGTWPTNNGIGITVNFGLGVGSTYSGTAGAWASATYMSATGATSVVGTNGATFYITGVQLEKGSTSTSFDYRPYGTELALCQRYYEKSFEIGTAPVNGSAGAFATMTGAYGGYTSNAAITGYIYFKVQKRTTPTMTFYGNSSGYWYANGFSVNAAFGTPSDSGYGIAQQAVVGFAITQGHWAASAEL